MRAERNSRPPQLVDNRSPGQVQLEGPKKPRAASAKSARGAQPRPAEAPRTEAQLREALGREQRAALVTGAYGRANDCDPIMGTPSQPASAPRFVTKLPTGADTNTKRALSSAVAMRADLALGPNTQQIDHVLGVDAQMRTAFSQAGIHLDPARGLQLPNDATSAQLDTAARESVERFVREALGWSDAEVKDDRGGFVATHGGATARFDASQVSFKADGFRAQCDILSDGKLNPAAFAYGTGGDEPTVTVERVFGQAAEGRAPGLRAEFESPAMPGKLNRVRVDADGFMHVERLDLSVRGEPSKSIWLEARSNDSLLKEPATKGSAEATTRISDLVYPADRREEDAFRELPPLKQLETSPQFKQALQDARALAKERNVSIELFDTVASQGRQRMGTVDPAGGLTLAESYCPDIAYP